jgi:hypothetical protein
LNAMSALVQAQADRAIAETDQSKVKLKIRQWDSSAPRAQTLLENSDAKSVFNAKAGDFATEKEADLKEVKKDKAEIDALLALTNLPAMIDGEDVVEKLQNWIDRKDPGPLTQTPRLDRLRSLNLYLTRQRADFLELKRKSTPELLSEFKALVKKHADDARTERLELEECERAAETALTNAQNDVTRSTQELQAAKDAAHGKGEVNEATRYCDAHLAQGNRTNSEGRHQQRRATQGCLVVGHCVKSRSD